MEVQNPDNHEANPAGDVDIQMEDESNATDQVPPPFFNGPNTLASSIADLVDRQLPEDHIVRLGAIHQSALLLERELSALRIKCRSKENALKTQKKEIITLKEKLAKLAKRTHTAVVRIRAPEVIVHIADSILDMAGGP